MLIKKKKNNRVASEFVNAKNAELRSRNDQDQSQKTLLEVYLTSKDLDVKDVVTMVSDMLLAGIDTVATKHINWSKIQKCF